MKISKQAIDNPLNTSLFFVMIIIMGIFSYLMLTIEHFPEIEIPKIIISTIYPGASPKEIEFEINKKIEDEIKNITEIKKIESIASRGVGTTIIDFFTGVDIQQKKTDIKDAIDKISANFPEDVEKSSIKELDFSKNPVISIVLYQAGQDYVTLKDYAKRLKDALLRIPEIGDIIISGGLDREISVHVDPILMWGHKVNILEVLRFFSGGNREKTSGKIQIGTREYPITVPAQFTSAQDIKNSILQYRDGKPLYLREIGTIEMGTKEAKSFARYNEIPAISLGIIKQSNSNMIKLSKKVNAALEEIEQSDFLPRGVKLLIVGDQSDEIHERVNELTGNIFQGTLIVLLTLYLTLGWRNALIASISIPFAILFTMIGLLIFDQSINNLSQFALIIMIGIVVDGAIVVLENINQHKERGISNKDAAKEGVQEVGGAVISSGLTTMSAFAPMLFMTGIVGQFMGVIPKTVIIGLTGSLVFDHIFIPMLCSKFLPSKNQATRAPWERIYARIFKSSTEIRISTRIMKHYHKVLKWALVHPKLTLFYALLGFLTGLLLISLRPKEFFPELDLGKFWINIELASGTTLEASDAKTREVEQLLHADLRTEENPGGILSYYLTNIGSTGISIQNNQIGARGTHIARIELKMIDAQERSTSIDSYITQLRKRLTSQISGATLRLEKPKAGPPVGAPVNIVIQGDDLRVLKKLAQKAKARLRKVSGAVEIRDNYGPGKTEIEVKIQEALLERYGLNAQEVQALIAVLNQGYELATYQYGQDTYQIRIQIDEQYNQSLDDLKMTPIYIGRFKQVIPITAIADITLRAGFSSIHREGFKRAITISADVDRSMYTSSQVAYGAIQEFSDFSVPQGYSLSFKGENEDRDESLQGLQFAFVLGILAIYFIVVIELRSFLQPLNILTAIPLALLGISVGLTIGGENLGIMAMFGIVSLLGIVVNDSIVFLSQINAIRSQGKSLQKAIVQAGTRRLRPIFLTTFTTIGSLLPLALGIGSRKFFSAMGWSIIGGLLFATFQILLILPVLYTQSEQLKIRFLAFMKGFSVNKNRV